MRLIPGRDVPLCLECAGIFDPRCVVRWNAPLWVVHVSVGADPRREGKDNGSAIDRKAIGRIETEVAQLNALSGAVMDSLEQ